MKNLIRAISSAGEHCLHTAGVTGSIPVSPTRLRSVRYTHRTSPGQACHGEVLTQPGRQLLAQYLIYTERSQAPCSTTPR